MKSVATSVREGVFEVRLSRPEIHNAFDGELIDGLVSAVEEAGKQGDVRVLLLAAEGKSFCAGADVEWMRRQGEASREENERSALRLASLYEAIDSLDLPVVARVQGAAIGGGVGLVAACDVAVASARATFALAEVRIGLVPAVISPFVLRKIGLSRCRDLFLTGRRIDAEEALRIGLVHHLASEEKLDEAVGRVLADLRSAGPEAVRRAKRLLRDLPGLLEGDRKALALRTAREIAEARGGEEGRAGTRAFLEKKSPPWSSGGAR